MNEVTVPIVPVAFRGPEGLPETWVALRRLEKPSIIGSTRVRLSWDGEALYLMFDSASEPPVRVSSDPASPVFEDECVEVFWQGSRPHGEYLEFVVNPAGRVYAASVFNPSGDRASWRVDPWKAPPAIVTSIEGDPSGTLPTEWKRWKCSLRLPWNLLEPSGLSPATRGKLSGNLFRIRRSQTASYEALSPTGRISPPDFHVPDRFARFALIDLL
jgi:hypothetical protein